MGGLFSKGEKRKLLEAKRAEEGHYSTTGRPGGSEQYTGIKVGKAPDAKKRKPRRGRGARTPVTP